jgi:hypothetical protein
LSRPDISSALIPILKRLDIWATTADQGSKGGN